MFDEDVQQANLALGQFGKLSSDVGGDKVEAAIESRQANLFLNPHKLGLLRGGKVSLS